MSDTATQEATTTADSATPALDRMVEALGGEPVSSADAMRDLAAKSGEKQPDEPAAEDVTSQGDKEQPERKSYSTEEKNARERARTALRRDGVPVAVIDALDDDKLLKWGMSRAKAQSDTDDAYRQLGELRKAQETQAAKAASGAQKESGTTEPPDEPFDFGALGKTLASSLNDDEAGALVGSLKSLDDRGAKRARTLEAKLTEVSSANERLANALLRLEMREVHRELGESFPPLRDDRNRSKLEEKMQKLAPSGAYESLSDLAREAAILLWPEEVARRSNDNVQLRERRNGTPTTGSRQTPPKALSEREKAMSTLEALERKHGLIP